MSLALSICIKKRTQIRPGNPYGRTCLDLWGAPAHNQEGRGGAVRPSRPVAKSATVENVDANVANLVFQIASIFIVLLFVFHGSSMQSSIYVSMSMRL